MKWEQDSIRPIGEGITLEKMELYFLVGDTIEGDFSRLTGMVKKYCEGLPLMWAVKGDNGISDFTYALDDSTMVIPFYIDREGEQLLFTRWKKSGKDIWSYVGPIGPSMESKNASHKITGQHRTEDYFYLIGETRFGEGGDIGHAVWLSLYEPERQSILILDRFQAKYLDGEEDPVRLSWKIEDPVWKVFLHQGPDDIPELIRVIRL